MSHETTATASRRDGLISAAIIVGGVLTMLSAFLAFPVGIALTGANAVLAVVTRGTKRRLFISFATAGAVLCAVVASTLFAARF